MEGKKCFYFIAKYPKLCTNVPGEHCTISQTWTHIKHCCLHFWFLSDFHMILTFNHNSCQKHSLEEIRYHRSRRGTIRCWDCRTTWSCRYKAAGTDFSWRFKISCIISVSFLWHLGHLCTHKVRTMGLIKEIRALWNRIFFKEINW